MGQIASSCTGTFFDQDIWMDLYAICAITDIWRLQAACSKAWPGFGPCGNKWNWEVNSTPYLSWQDQAESGTIQSIFHSFYAKYLISIL
jgi:hypothetical protein